VTIRGGIGTELLGRVVPRWVGLEQMAVDLDADLPVLDAEPPWISRRVLI
jgi:hypothetical protein